VLKLRLVVQLAIGILFLISSAGKLRDRGSFTEGLAAYRILPSSWASVGGLFIIGVESFLAAAHISGHLLKVGLLAGLALIASFALAVCFNLARGRVLPCYCFGSSGSTISWATLARLALLAFGEAFLLRMYQPLLPLRLAVLQLAFALFWSILLLVAGLWLFAVGDVVRLLRFAR
jgi:Methylamine utilisation protein MauE